MRTHVVPKNAKLLMATSLAVGLMLTGCGTNDTPEPSPPEASAQNTQSTESQSPDETTDGGATQDQIEETSSEPVGEFTTELYESDDWPAFGDTEGIYPVDVRSAVHDGFERIVIEHAGSGTPSYMAQYTDEPVEPGRGEPIDTGDNAYLEVIASGTASIDDIDEEQMLDNGEEITNLETEATGTVVCFAPWEATSNYFIGLDEQRPYAVTILEDPVRIVIDIQLDEEP